jgi:hypothetical protein
MSIRIQVTNPQLGNNLELKVLAPQREGVPIHLSVEAETNVEFPPGVEMMIRQLGHPVQTQVPLQGTKIPPKINLSLYSPQVMRENQVKGSSHCKKLSKQGNLCPHFILTSENCNRVNPPSKVIKFAPKRNPALYSPQVRRENQDFSLTFKEFNQVTYKASAHEPRPSRHPVTQFFLSVHRSSRVPKLQSSQVFSQEHHPEYRIFDLGQLSTQLSAYSAVLSFSTPVMMMCPSVIAQWPVQQAVVDSHGAAESYHEECQWTQWDVWIATLSVRSHQYPFSSSAQEPARCNQVTPRPASMNEVEAKLDE